MDNLILPMINWLTIGTDGTDGQCFGGQPYAIALMLTTSFTNGLYKFTDRQIISPSVEMDNLYLPMVNWLTTRNDGTDGQCFGGLPYGIAIMLTTSFTNGLYKYPMENYFSIGIDGQSNFTDCELAYHRYRRYRRTVFGRATLCHRNNANYLIHHRTLQIYRSSIHFSIGIDGQSLFTDGELGYHL
jgi:hypothetical protein